MLRRSLAFWLASAALLAACGGDERPATNTSKPTPSPSPSAELGLTQPVISAPLDGTAITADSREAEQLTAAVLVRGVAEPDTRVVVSGGCQAEGCRTAVRTAEDGGFQAEVRLTARPRGTIIVGYEDQRRSVGSDRVVVTLEPPPVVPAEEPSRTPTPSSTSSPGTTTSARTLVVIGDSLAVGMRPFLAQYLAGWNVNVDAHPGRALAEGMAKLAASPRPDSKTVYAFSLFTNDDPRTPAALEGAVRRSFANGCAVWATIAAPAVGGTTYAAANARLDELAAAAPARLRIVEWAERVSRNPGWLTGDGVHATPTGYRNRAALYAAAVKTCGD